MHYVKVLSWLHALPTLSSSFLGLPTLTGHGYWIPITYLVACLGGRDFLYEDCKGESSESLIDDEKLACLLICSFRMPPRDAYTKASQNAN